MSYQFSKEYPVHVYDMGPDGRLSLCSLFNFMQDVASDHAELLGFGRDDLLKNNRFWVLSRIYASVSFMPLWEDRVLLKTWPCGTDKLFALRNYEAFTPAGKYVASGSSSWLILDRDSKKIQRPDSVLPPFNPDMIDVKHPVRNPERLGGADENGEMSDCYRIKISDLDINLHTNNVNYLKWIIDTYDLDFMMNSFPQSAEINYLAESKFDEEIIVKTSAVDQHLFTHSVFRKVDGKELCRVRLTWEKHN